MDGSVMICLPFSDILNVHQEYCQTIKSFHERVPRVVFCNSYDNCCKINHIFKRDPYAMINKVLKQQFLALEIKEIESEIRQ